jgi:hypothetical protein
MANLLPYLIFKMTILPFDISDYVGNDNVSEMDLLWNNDESAWAIDNITT